MKKLIVFLAFLLTSYCSTSSYAFDSFSYEYSRQYCNETIDSYSVAMPTKLLRGVTNVLTGWLEFPRSIYVTTRDNGPLQGLIIGPARGIFATAGRTLTGAVEAATFMIPAPGFYSPLLEERPLVWSYPNDDEGILIYRGPCDY
jgi:putative exosortase-associated protein (TIGR04073 family)